MKVVQVLYSGLGGHGSVALSLQAAATRSAAWQGALVFVGVEPLLPEYERVCAAQGIPSRYVRSRPGHPWAAWRAIHAALAEFEPDAVILHSVKTIVPCALYARRRGIPVLAVEHQNNGLKRRAEWWVSRLLMRLADGVVVLTEDYGAELRHGLGAAWRGEKVHVIPNGIDTDAFSPRAATTRGATTIGMASRITGIKRHDLLLEALVLLRSEDGPDAWRLTLAGDGDTLPALRQQVRELRLEDAVAFPGYLGEEALRSWFAAIDIYAHASAGETLSTSLLQALAAGLPIVGSDVPGIGNLLAAGGGCGIAVEQTPQAFASAFRRIARNAAFAEGLRLRARAHAVAEFSQAAMFSRYQRVLQDLCAR